MPSTAFVESASPPGWGKLVALDKVLVVLAAIKGLVISPFLLGLEPTSIVGVLNGIERPFLVFLFRVAEVFMPFSRVASRAGVSSRDATFPSRDPNRTIAVRVHEPPTVAPDAPLIMWAHGGGLFLGSAVGEDVLARYFAARLGATTVSVEYRRAPEYVWPCAIHDCIDAACALKASYAPGRKLIVAGMSAGGYLAIQTALELAHVEQPHVGGCHVHAHAAIAPMVGPFNHFPSIWARWRLGLFPYRQICFGWSTFLRDAPCPHEWDWRVSSLLASDEQLRATCPGVVTYHVGRAHIRLGRPAACTLNRRPERAYSIVHALHALHPRSPSHQLPIRSAEATRDRASSLTLTGV